MAEVTTFYGESWCVSWAKNSSGAALWNDGYELIYHFDGYSCVMSAGDSFVVGMETGSSGAYRFTGESDAQIAWAVEVGGRGGTFRLRSGLDPTWNLDNPALATHDRGTHVDGGTTVVVGESAISPAELWAGSDQPILFVECISGEVEVVQVKLRVWPAGGVEGSWAEGPAFTHHLGGSVSRYQSFESVLDSGPDGDWVATPEAARADAVGKVFAKNGQPAPWFLGTPPRSPYSEVFWFYSGSAGWTCYATVHATYLRAADDQKITYPHAAVDAGSSYGANPYEWYGEGEAWVQQLGGGTLKGTFSGWDDSRSGLNVVLGTETALQARVVFGELPSWPTLEMEVFGKFNGGAHHFPPPENGTVVTTSGTRVSLPPNNNLIVAVYVEGIYQLPPIPSGNYDDYYDLINHFATVDDDSVKAYPSYAVPSHWYWDPTLPSSTYDPALLPGQFLNSASNLDGEHVGTLVRFVGQ